MDQLKTYADDRLINGCIYCGGLSLNGAPLTEMIRGAVAVLSGDECFFCHVVFRYRIEKTKGKKN